MSRENQQHFFVPDSKHTDNEGHIKGKNYPKMLHNFLQKPFIFKKAFAHLRLLDIKGQINSSKKQEPS